jgi:hypothetical protein
VRRHHQAALPLPEASQVLERGHGLARSREVEQQDVTALDGPLDPGNQRDPARGRVAGQRPQVELALVKRDRERLVTPA